MCEDLETLLWWPHLLSSSCPWWTLQPYRSISPFPDTLYPLPSLQWSLPSPWNTGFCPSPTKCLFIKTWFLLTDTSCVKLSLIPKCSFAESKSCVARILSTNNWTSTMSWERGTKQVGMDRSDRVPTLTEHLENNTACDVLHTARNRTLSSNCN